MGRLIPQETKKSRRTGSNGFRKLREPDLNRRPRGYEPRELPGCSIPRGKRYRFPPGCLALSEFSWPENYGTYGTHGTDQGN
jgi:hypothetical protein